MKTRAIFVYTFYVLWVEFFLSNIGFFNLFKKKYKIKAQCDDQANSK